MFIPNIASGLLMDLTTDEQQLLAGGKKYCSYRRSDDEGVSPAETSTPPTPSTPATPSTPYGGESGGLSVILGYRITATPYVQCPSGGETGEY